MFNIMQREELIKNPEFKEILRKESHHNHEIVEDEKGVIRWKENPNVTTFRKNISLNDLLPLLNNLGYDKNSEIYRKLHRDMGVPLSTYWEIFYWKVNNKKADEYNYKLSEKEKIDYKIKALRRDREENISKWAEALMSSMVFIVILILVLKSCANV